LVIGYWLLVIGYWLLVIGYWLLVIGEEEVATSLAWCGCLARSLFFISKCIGAASRVALPG
jgi:hypothetical protein